MSAGAGLVRLWAVLLMLASAWRSTGLQLDVEPLNWTGGRCGRASCVAE